MNTNNTTPAKVDSKLYEQLCDYVKSDLRKRFDDLQTKPQAQINIIDEARSFGFTELVKEMAEDFMGQSVDCLNLYRIHEQANGRNVIEDEADKFHDYQMELEHHWNQEQEERFLIPNYSGERI